ncbi:MAG: hypothetical protein ACO1SV_26065 [Fimbriimonas sp.]
MSTRVLKGITGTLIALGFLIMLAWPFLVGLPTKNGTRAERRSYAVRALVTTASLALVVIGAGTGAFLVIRRTREEYREESMKNLRELLEGTREAQLRKKQGEKPEESAD